MHGRFMSVLGLGGAMALGLAACGPSAPPAPPAPTEPAANVTQPEGWDDELALPIPVDLNPDPHILEIELDARVAAVANPASRPTTS